MVTATNISSRQLMDEIVLRAALEIIGQLKAYHKGNENLIMRDLKLLHGNTTFGDLPEYLKNAVKLTTASSFGYMNKQGFVLVPRDTKGR